MTRRRYLRTAVVILVVRVLMSTLAFPREEGQEKEYSSIMTFSTRDTVWKIIVDGVNRTEEFKEEEAKARRAVEKYFGNEEELKDWRCTHLESLDTMTLEFSYQGQAYTANWIDSELVNVLESQEE